MSWLIVELKLSGEFDGQGNNNSVKRYVIFAWERGGSFCEQLLCLQGNIKQDFCNACLMIHEGVSSLFKQMEDLRAIRQRNSSVYGILFPAACIKWHGITDIFP